MSSQQRMRPNASPSTKPGPLRATVPVALMGQGSPTNKKSSPTDSLRLPQGLRISRQCSPENRINVSPERKCSPILQAEKSKTLNSRSGSSSSVVGGSSQVIRRTASLDALHLGSAGGGTATSQGPQHQPQGSFFLQGQWNREAALQGQPHLQHGNLLSHTYCGRLMVDRATQTPDDWDENEKKRTQRKSNETLEMRYMRHRLQRSGGGTRVLSPQHPQAVTSQVQGQPYQVSSPVSMGSPLISGWSSCHSPSLLARPLASLPPEGSSRAAPIPIPHIPKPLVPRLRNSVEGLNQEIEKLVLKDICGLDSDGSDMDKIGDQAIDGHRAPIAKLFHGHQVSHSAFCVPVTSSVDTQTPSGVRESAGCRVESSSSGGGSPSPPALPLMLSNPMSRPPSAGGKSASPELPDYAGVSGKTPSDPSPPRIDRFLAREPPDGCEKVKVIEEPSKQSGPSLPFSSINVLQGMTPAGTKVNLLRPCMTFVLQPSQSSAFCPLYKPYLPPSNSSTPATALPSKAQLSASAPPSSLNERLQ